MLAKIAPNGIHAVTIMYLIIMCLGFQFGIVRVSKIVSVSEISQSLVVFTLRTSVC